MSGRESPKHKTLVEVGKKFFEKYGFIIHSFHVLNEKYSKRPDFIIERDNKRAIVEVTHGRGLGDVEGQLTDYSKYYPNIFLIFSNRYQLDEVKKWFKDVEAIGRMKLNFNLFLLSEKDIVRWL